MTSFTIEANEQDRRIRLIPTETDDGMWTYRVTEMDGTQIDDEPHFAPVATLEACECSLRHVYRTASWDLREDA